MKIASRLNQVSEYYFAKKLAEIAAMNANGDNVINLGVGSPDLPPHESVIKVLIEESQKPNIHGYQGYRGIEPLRKAFAGFYKSKYGVELNHNEQVLPLFGSKEGIVHISMTYLEPGDKVLIPNPGYPAYRAASLLAGAECIEYKLNAENDWLPDLNELNSPDLSNVKIMWINYPNMPTGRAADKFTFEKLVSFAAKNNILLCHDNPYSMILNDNPMSILSVPGAFETAVELNSLSKSSNMAGWRIGALVGSKENIDNVLRFKSNLDSGMFYASQKAAVAALELPDDWYKSLNEVYSSRKKTGLKILETLGCTIPGKQSGFFIWAKIPANGSDCYSFSDKVLSGAKVFLTPGGIFGSEGNNYIRLSLCTPVELLIEALERIKDL